MKKKTKSSRSSKVARAAAEKKAKTTGQRTVDGYYFGRVTIKSLAALGVHAVIGKRAE